MNQVHVIGSSFTNWFYPTWADYIQKHYDVELHNLAYGGSGNSALKKKLYTIDKSDHVFIMFGCRWRGIVGIDEEFIARYVSGKETMNKLLDALKYDNRSWFRSSSPTTAFVNKRTFGIDWKTSLFEECYQMLEDIYDCQNYLQAKGIDYNFSQVYSFYTVHEKRTYNTYLESIDINKYMQNSIYSKVYNSIDHDKIFPSIDKGMWEYNVDKSKVLELFNNKVDLHPSTLCHFYFFKTYIKPILDQKMPNKNNIDHLYSQAKKFSEYYQEHETVKREFTNQLKTKYFEIFENL